MRPRTLALAGPLVPGLFLACVLAWGSPTAEAQGGATRQANAPRQSETLQDTEQRLGPFRIGGHDFSVVLRSKRPPAAHSDRPDEAALASLEIKDASGATVHQETFSYVLERGTFAHACTASAQLLAGGAASGLLINVGCLPSAPHSGGVWELFGLMNGRLVRFGKPFTTDGDFLGLIPNPPRTVGRARLFLPDVMQFRVWAGNFRVTVPLHVDWMQGRLMPGQRCFEQTGRGARDSGCDVPVEAARVPSDQDLTFVRLFTEASEGMGIPRHVVVRKDSKVEILAAKIKMSWDQSRDVIIFGVDDQDPWLKVRIDGQEGWIHTQEDFNAIGLPQAG